jgi:hypothetical protein
LNNGLRLYKPHVSVWPPCCLLYRQFRQSESDPPLRFAAIMINSINKASEKMSNGISNPLFAAHWYSSSPIPISNTAFS